MTTPDKFIDLFSVGLVIMMTLATGLSAIPYLNFLLHEEERTFLLAQEMESDKEGEKMEKDKKHKLNLFHSPVGRIQLSIGTFLLPGDLVYSIFHPEIILPPPEQSSFG